MNLAKRQILGLHQRRIFESTQALDGKMHLRIWSQNIRSFHSNGEDLLDRAVAHKVSLIALQEMNIGEQALPSVINLAKRKGWQMAARERERQRERDREREREREREY
jgi:hypothetical protein